MQCDKSGSSQSSYHKWKGCWYLLTFLMGSTNYIICRAQCKMKMPARCSKPIKKMRNSRWQQLSIKPSEACGSDHIGHIPVKLAWFVGLFKASKGAVTVLSFLEKTWCNVGLGTFEPKSESCGLKFICAVSFQQPADLVGRTCGSHSQCQSSYPSLPSRLPLSSQTRQGGKENTEDVRALSG